jgi:hypothetical protein
VPLEVRLAQQQETAMETLLTVWSVLACGVLIWSSVLRRRSGPIAEGSGRDLERMPRLHCDLACIVE